MINYISYSRLFQNVHTFNLKIFIHQRVAIS